jgi:hypothetical protein
MQFMLMSVVNHHALPRKDPPRVRQLGGQRGTNVNGNFGEENQGSNLCHPQTALAAGRVAGGYCGAAECVRESDGLVLIPNR